MISRSLRGNVVLRPIQPRIGGNLPRRAEPIGDDRVKKGVRTAKSVHRIHLAPAWLTRFPSDSLWAPRSPAAIGACVRGWTIQPALRARLGTTGSTQPIRAEPGGLLPRNSSARAAGLRVFVVPGCCSAPEWVGATERSVAPCTRPIVFHALDSAACAQLDANFAHAGLSNVKSCPARCGTPRSKIGRALIGPAAMISWNCRRKLPRSSGASSSRS